MFRQVEPIIGLICKFKHLAHMWIPAFKHFTLYYESHPRYHYLGVNYWPLISAWDILPLQGGDAPKTPLETAAKCK